MDKIAIKINIESKYVYLCDEVYVDMDMWDGWNDRNGFRKWNGSENTDAIDRTRLLTNSLSCLKQEDQSQPLDVTPSGTHEKCSHLFDFKSPLPAGFTVKEFISTIPTISRTATVAVHCLFLFLFFTFFKRLNKEATGRLPYKIHHNENALTRKLSWAFLDQPTTLERRGHELL